MHIDARRLDLGGEHGGEEDLHPSGGTPLTRGMSRPNSLLHLWSVADAVSRLLGVLLRGTQQPAAWLVAGAVSRAASHSGRKDFSSSLDPVRNL